MRLLQTVMREWRCWLRTCLQPQGMFYKCLQCLAEIPQAIFGWYSYSLSKVALRFLIENYAIENKKMHFINCSPGLIETSMQKKIRKIDHKIIPSIKTFKEAHLNNKIQKPAEAAIKFYNNIPIMLKSSSGTYLDLRKIN